MGGVYGAYSPCCYVYSVYYQLQGLGIEHDRPRSSIREYNGVLYDQLGSGNWDGPGILVGFGQLVIMPAEVLC